jgi:hypothetical protein
VCELVWVYLRCGCGLSCALPEVCDLDIRAGIYHAIYQR